MLSAASFLARFGYLSVQLGQSMPPGNYLRLARSDLITQTDGFGNEWLGCRWLAVLPDPQTQAPMDIGLAHPISYSVV